MSYHMILITDAITCKESIERMVHTERYVWQTTFFTATPPPSISLASLAASSALPQEFRLINDIISGVALQESFIDVQERVCVCVQCRC